MRQLLLWQGLWLVWLMFGLFNKMVDHQRLQRRAAMMEYTTGVLFVEAYSI
jgi:hypothetical protein